MTDQLQNFFGDLDAKIKERTTQLKRAKEAAESANHSKDRFIANISHELRNPLNGIIGYAKLLRRELPLNSEQIEEFKIIEESGLHLLNLINDLLDFSKNQANKMELHFVEINLPEFLRLVVGIINNEAKAKELKIITKFENIPNRVLADPKRLQQVLINLLYNAIKFTDRGQVTLKVTGISNFVIDRELTRQKIRFEVIDTGVGISQEEQIKIFQPFEQTGDFSLRKVGTGLGLSISKQLVELMGGKLKVKSQLGQGSNFWFETNFTLGEDNPDTPQKSKFENILGYEGRERIILVVDDKEKNRLLLVNILEPLGFKVLTAGDGEQMFTVINQEKPDLICLDLLMPKKTGLTSAIQLKQTPELKHIPLIIISATIISEELYQSLRCEEFLGKPIDEEKLLDLLQKYLHLEWIYQEDNHNLLMSNNLNSTTQLGV